jgi:hypothetical protein
MSCGRMVLFQTEHRESQWNISRLLTRYESVRRREVCQIIDSNRHCQCADTLCSSVVQHPTVVSAPTNRHADCYYPYNIEQHETNVAQVANYTAWPSWFTLSKTWQKLRCSNTRISASAHEFGQEDDVDLSDGLIPIA